MLPNPQEPANLVIFTEEILNGRFHFLCSGIFLIKTSYRTTYIFTGNRIQRTLSATNQIKKITLNVATRYNTDLLSNYLGCQYL